MFHRNGGLSGGVEGAGCWVRGVDGVGVSVSYKSSEYNLSMLRVEVILCVVFASPYICLAVGHHSRSSFFLSTRQVFTAILSLRCRVCFPPCHTTKGQRRDKHIKACLLRGSNMLYVSPTLTPSLHTHPPISDISTHTYHPFLSISYPASLLTSKKSSVTS